MKALRVFYLVSVCYMVLVAVLFKMQVLDHRLYKNLSERNRIHPVILEAPRGLILDRFGRELVSNRLSFDCAMIPQESKPGLDRTLRKLSEISGVPEDLLRRRYRQRVEGPFKPVVLIQDLEKDDAIQIEELSDILPGVFIKTRPVREYHLRDAGAHVFGYVGPVDPEEYRILRNDGYRLNDWVGKTGLEKQYERVLRGQQGAVQYEVDSRGRLLRVLNIREPLEGKTIQLEMDGDLQRFSSDLMKGQTGALAVMDLESGGILALTSAPSFDPNLFASPFPHRPVIESLLRDSKKPFLNRTISGEYPPGSTFKIITATAALKSGKINDEVHFFCPGFFRLGNRNFQCWRHEGHGSQGILEALEHSCNVFFYQTGIRMDIQELAKEAQAFGLGGLTGIDLPGEKRGLVPSREWKRRTFPKDPVWYLGETVIAAIGQGYLTVTPLQMLEAATFVATGGWDLKPHLVRRNGGSVPREKKNQKPIFSGPLLRLLREGMERVVESPTGTGQRARVEGIRVAGKTGTSQAPVGQDHAWFVGYIPSDYPKAAIVVFLEHGGRGGLSAASIAGRVFRWMADQGYFR